MAKNDWAVADTLTRSRVNQPYYIASATYDSGGPRFTLQISPGSLKYPHLYGVTYSGQANFPSINNPKANEYYSVFYRSDQTLIISGTSSPSSNPGPPRYDATLLGKVVSIGSLDTANMTGPWNQGAFAGYEQRGQMPSPNPPRAIYTRQVAAKAIPYNDDISSASGIAYCGFTEVTRPLGSVVMAQVTWMPSGAFPVSQSDVYLTPIFLITRGNPSSSFLQIARETKRYEVAQNPDDSVTRGARNFVTTSISVTVPGPAAPDANDPVGFRLCVYFDSSVTDATVTPGIRLSSVTMSVQPALYASEDAEK